MSHPLFTPEVRFMLAEDNVRGLKAFCENLHPSTIAETLAEDEFTPDQVWKVLADTGIRNQAAVFEYFPIQWQVRMAEGTGRPHMARLIEQMSHDDRVDLLRRLTPRVSEALLRLVDEADRRDIANLFRYTENTVCALMTTDYAWLPGNLTAGQAIDRLRQQAPDRETIYYVYILDESTRRLTGVLSLRNLIMADRHTMLHDLIDDELMTLKASDDREKAAELLGRYDLLAVPVVDDEGRLVGIVTHDDVLDVVTEEATEALQRQAGVGPIAENYLEAGFFNIWRKRAFWLACLFGAELLTFTALAQYEEALAEILVLTLFIPLCISTGGNSGSQAATLITRSLALGHIGVKDWWRILKHEWLMGIVLGLTLGVIALFRGAMTSEDLRSETKKLDEPFEVFVANNQTLKKDDAGKYVLEPGMLRLAETPVKKETKVTLPEGVDPKEVSSTPEGVRYQFPSGCTTKKQSVSRWRLAVVIAQAVASICLWGTIIGAMLPLAFRRIGVDPALASSPFVATFVDVTGIVLYFSIAKLYLL